MAATKKGLKLAKGKGKGRKAKDILEVDSVIDAGGGEQEPLEKFRKAPEGEEYEPGEQPDLPGVESEKDLKLERKARALAESKAAYSDAGKDVMAKSKLLLDYMHENGITTYRRGDVYVNIKNTEKLDCKVLTEEEQAKQVVEQIF
jgi:hypothetical protein